MAVESYDLFSMDQLSLLRSLRHLDSLRCGIRGLACHVGTLRWLGAHMEPASGGTFRDPLHSRPHQHHRLVDGCHRPEAVPHRPVCAVEFDCGR